MAAPILAVFAFRDVHAPFHAPFHAPLDAGAHAARSFSIESITAIRGDTLAHASRLDVHEGSHTPPSVAPLCYALRGSTGHLRYVEQPEKQALAKTPPVLGRAAATRATLIPIRKSDAWWELPQDERRAILETRSRHIAIGLDYVSVIARRLYHARELGEPFDFLTWFEYAPADAPRFAELLAALRASEEWRYVEREVQVELSRE